MNNLEQHLSQCPKPREWDNGTKQLNDIKKNTIILNNTLSVLSIRNLHLKIHKITN